MTKLEDLERLARNAKMKIATDEHRYYVTFTFQSQEQMDEMIWIFNREINNNFANYMIECRTTIKPIPVVDSELEKKLQVRFGCKNKTNGHKLKWYMLRAMAECKGWNKEFSRDYDNLMIDRSLLETLPSARNQPNSKYVKSLEKQVMKHVGVKTAKGIQNKIQKMKQGARYF